jgi:Fe-S oxidoreductase
LRELYGLDAKVMHLSQFLTNRVEDTMMTKIGLGKVAYHDPCRLGRYMGEYEAPRLLLTSIPDVELMELEFEKDISRCCGVSSWISCTEGSKRLRQARLKEAEDVGAEVLVTACPKCRIHLNCYLSNEKVDPVKVKVEDLTVLLAKAMGVWR